MIHVFYGDDRVRAKQEISRLLGSDYEVLDGAEIMVADLPSIFMGATLFATKRRILIRDFTVNRAAYDELAKYIETPHEVVFLETKLDKRTTTYKKLQGKMEFREFKLATNVNFGAVFDIYRTAKRDGEKAVRDLEKIKANEDPIGFIGLLVSQALKDFNLRQGATERKVLKELARVDLETKSTKIDPWLIIESFLLRMSSL